MSTHVAVCIPSFDTWHADYGMSLAQLVGHTANACPDVEVSIHNIRTALICESRAMLVRSAMRESASHVLFLDSDMSFPANTLARLLAHRAPFVAANYATRSLQVESTAYTPEGVAFEPAGDGTGLRPALGVGLGVALVAVQVFLALSQPWFPIVFAPDGSTCEGEDIGFCRKASAAGFRPMVDLDLSREVGHIGTCTYKLAGRAERLDGYATPNPLHRA